jgi:1A family penicillin-binding protein
MLLRPVKKYKKTKISNPAFAFFSKNFFFILGGIFVLGATIFTVWVITLKLPDFNDFQTRLTHRSTQIYDRTGKVLLYDLHKDVKRTVVPLSEMSPNIQRATIAVEDDKFYEHFGVRPLALLRAVILNVIHGKYVQGGSTITQQVIKNTLLTQKKTIARKLKEIILSIKLERKMTKDQILEAYLNESSYGGNIYGVEQAAQTYFGKPAKELNIAEAAYLAAIPQSPTYYSPYGRHTDALLERQQFVLKRMHDVGYLSDDEYQSAKQLAVTTIGKGETKGIKAPHFVFYIEDYLLDTYGEDMVQNGGLRVITTLDYEAQKQAEKIALEGSQEIEKTFNASNLGFVAIDPKTGQILSMVGSRDYFDDKIDGAFNITTALRQPGSAFKPIVYSLGFMKGYTADTVLFDVPTEFNATCTPGDQSDRCYSPVDYDGQFRGPMTVRKALAQSINVPAVKMLYLVGLNNAIKFAQDLGITTLNPDHPYGLTLVLGGGEVKLLDMTSVYSVFASEGVKRKTTGIIRVENSDGDVLEEYKDDPGTQVIPQNIAREMNDVLSDNESRVPTFSPTSALYFPNATVAAKTGTTNDYRDVWVLGYTPNIVLGAWAGNNDNSPMIRRTSGTIIAPIWHKLMEYMLDRYPPEPFVPYVKDDNYDSLPPILRGVWQTPQGVHDILYYIDKNNPLGPPPANPYDDPQFKNWEAGVQGWFGIQTPTGGVVTPNSTQTGIPLVPVPGPMIGGGQ